MDSGADTSKRWVAPFGHLGINACSRLPQDFRSVPRPSSPPGAKASTRCPSLAQNPSCSHTTSLAQDPSNRGQGPDDSGQEPVVRAKTQTSATDAATRSHLQIES